MGIDDFALFWELKRLNLLFVEDSQIGREFGYRFFRRFFKSIDIAKNGKEAIEFLKKKRYDILITDLVMPDVNGFELIEYVKKHNPDMYIVILSAFFDTETLLEAIYHGVDGFLIKPFNTDKFLKIMKKILYHKIKTEEEINILKQYKDIVDENMIVSKCNLDGRITYVNEGFEKISGFKKKELIGKLHNIVRHPDMKKEFFKKMWDTIKSKKTWKGLVKNRRKDGSSYYVDTVIKPILDRDGNIKEFIALRKDVTEFISAEKLINDKLQVIEKGLLVLVQIDNYHDIKIIYDEDTLNIIRRRLLKKIRLLLKEAFEITKNEIEDYEVREEILGYLIEKFDTQNIYQKIESVLKKVLNIPLVIKGIEYYPFVHISYSYGKEHLYQNAILGLEEIKESEKRIIEANGLCAKRKMEVIKNNEILKIIDYALKHNKVVSFFQPIVDNQTQKIIKYESLVRIIDKEGNVLSPYIFLGVAKKSGLYTQLALKVLENTFEAAYKKGIPISINLSPNDILRDAIKEKIYESLEKYNFERGMITFELLEDEIIKYPKSLKEFIEKVKAYGADIAVDDFGDGYSNFTRIAEVGADYIKIDGSIIKDIQNSKLKQDIVETIVNFAKKENKKTVAEFVENKEIYEILKKLGVDYSQGYYFSKPLRSEEI